MVTRKLLKKLAISSMGIAVIGAVPIMTGAHSTNVKSSQIVKLNQTGTNSHYHMDGGAARDRYYEAQLSTTATSVYNAYLGKDKEMFKFLTTQNDIPNTGQVGWEYGKHMNTDMENYNDSNDFFGVMTDSPDVHTGGKTFNQDQFAQTVAKAAKDNEGIDITFKTTYSTGHNVYWVTYKEASQDPTPSYNFAGGTAVDRFYKMTLNASETRNLYNAMNKPFGKQGLGEAAYKFLTDLPPYVPPNVNKAKQPGWEYGAAVLKDLENYSDDGSIQAVINNTSQAHYWGAKFDATKLYTSVFNAMVNGSGFEISFNTDYEFCAHNEYSVTYDEV